MNTTEHSTQSIASDTFASKGRTSRFPWSHFLLALIVAIAVLLSFVGLNPSDYANPYYAAAVKSMSMNWHNFFFVSFDPGGFVTVDKPPLGLWFQVLSTKLFGFNGFSLIFPQALAAVLSVLLLYHLVRRSFNVPAALLAALTLALMPITVATSRNNTVDCVLVLTVLLGAWAVLKASETGRLRWLLLCALFVGLGFNMKMLQAYLVVPAFGLLYLLASPRSWRVRILHLVFAFLLMLALSLLWVLVVDAISPSQRPYVGSSQTNSELELAFGYNGLERLLGMGGGKMPSAPAASSSASAGIGPMMGMMGPASPVRLFQAHLGSQVSWLIPLALFGLIAAACQLSWRLPLERKQQSLLLWGVWLLTMGIFFSVAGFFHEYYLVMMGPAISALVGIGLVALWQDYRQLKNWRSWLLPTALLLTAAVQAYILAGFSSIGTALTVLILLLSLLAAVFLLLARLLPRLQRPRLMSSALVVGMLALFLAPTAWSVITLVIGSNSMIPTAGPPSFAFSGQEIPGGNGPGGMPNLPGGGAPGGMPNLPGGNGPGRMPGFPGAGTGSRQGMGAMMPGFSSVDQKTIAYLEAHQGSSTYLVATLNATSAAPFILQTGKPVMAMGGFIGADPILTKEKVEAMVANNTVRTFLLTNFDASGMPPAIQEMFKSSGMGAMLGGGRMSEITTWIKQTCSAVPADQYQSASSNAESAMGQQLYTCPGPR